jgi:hypothetical protein
VHLDIGTFLHFSLHCGVMKIMGVRDRFRQKSRW